MRVWHVIALNKLNIFQRAVIYCLEISTTAVYAHPNLMQITYQKHLLSSLSMALLLHAVVSPTPLEEFSYRPLQKAGSVIMCVLLLNKVA